MGPRERQGENGFWVRWAGSIGCAALLALWVGSGCAAQRTEYEHGDADLPQISATNSPLWLRAYDEALLKTIQSRWFDLLSEQRMMRRDAGKVVVAFSLHPNGRVTSLRVVERSVADQRLVLFCQKAILDPEPYVAWPKEIRHLLGKDVRELKLTFLYQ